jgi:hypothetical protein
LLLLSHDQYLVTLIIIVEIIMGMMSSSFIMLIHPAQSLLFNSGSHYYRKDYLVPSCRPLYQGRISGGGHGIPSVSLRPAMSSLCAQQGAIPGPALGPLQGWPPAGQVAWGRPIPPLDTPSLLLVSPHARYLMSILLSCFICHFVTT